MSDRVEIRVADRAGDLGWMVQAHGEQYAAEFGWDQTFEALVAQIVADYAGHNDERQHGWIAELAARRAGCILCVPGDQPRVAKLRILLVTPQARGHGVGHRLVDEVVRFARAAGYERLDLWTNDVLSAARRIYRAVGFELVAEGSHHSYGHDLVEQTWTLGL